MLIEAPPGSGKTTALRRVAELIRERGATLAGFLTEEIREGRRRVGFSVESLASGERGVLSHVDLPGPPRVGRYGVDLAEFERLALPGLSAPADVVLCDELGKMELFSTALQDAISDLADRGRPMAATIHVYRHPFTDVLKRRSDLEVLVLTQRNRDELPAWVAERLMRERAD